MFFITVPDERIGAIALELAHRACFNQGTTFIHCSGCYDCSVFDALNHAGYEVASCHPMHNFAKPHLSIKSFAGSYCALEGTHKAISIGQALFKKIGGKPFLIDAKQKPLYHAAGIIASNYSLTLAHIANGCLCHAGIEEEMAIKIIIKLMTGTLNNLNATLSFEKSLTGPISRGDIETISQHLKHLGDDDAELYKLLGKLTLTLAKLPHSKKDAILKILRQEVSSHPK